ncbi:MAG: hypothetical protein VW771_00240 [Gammaproteobacteria bacterium]
MKKFLIMLLLPLSSLGQSEGVEEAATHFLDYNVTLHETSRYTEIRLDPDWQISILYDRYGRVENVEVENFATGRVSCHPRCN